ncbi:MAG: pyridoxal-phosphate dependent enzyme, partial [Armatimonadetes bacterium]|nr:pyridoxal-phosphate dependent enzyme [Armatimonadota bacterium]
MRLKGENLSSFVGVCSLVFVLAAFAAVLSVYGDSWLVPWHDEVVIVRLAQNLAEGKGFRNDLINGLIVGADERTYWQMPVFPLVLSLWGKIFGFDLNSLRAFSRIAGMVSLILLSLLCRKLGQPFPANLFAVLWTATDLTFQFAANFSRPDALTGCLLLLTVVLLASNLHENALGSATVGLLAGLAVFNHPIAFPCWLVSYAIIVKKSGWRKGSFFCLPFAFFAFLWLLYALNGWEIFLAQMKAHLSHKRYSLSDFLAFLTGLTAWGTEFYIGVPLNAIPPLLPLIVTAYVCLREKWLVPKWFLVFATVLYVSVMVGAEAWYPMLFVPFGYLMLAAFVNHLLQKATTKFGRFAIFVGALLWWSYQVSVVTRHLSSVPQIRDEVANFFSDLESLLPTNAKVLIGSFSPDPTFALMARRPDVDVYALMPQRMLNRGALERLKTQLTHMVLLKEATADPMFAGRKVKSWQFDFGGLSRGKRIVVFLLSLSEKRHNSVLRTNRRETLRQEAKVVVGALVSATELWERLSKLPRVSLGVLPTPLEPLPRISELLGVQVFIKRDDLTGLAFGGNKARHLEFGLGQAIHEGCDVVINGAAVQSNYCRQTAAACAKLGLKCALVLRRLAEV